MIRVVMGEVSGVGGVEEMFDLVWVVREVFLEEIFELRFER